MRPFELELAYRHIGQEQHQCENHEQIAGIKRFRNRGHEVGKYLHRILIVRNQLPVGGFGKILQIFRQRQIGNLLIVVIFLRIGEGPIGLIFGKRLPVCVHLFECQPVNAALFDHKSATAVVAGSIQCRGDVTVQRGQAGSLCSNRCAPQRKRCCRRIGQVQKLTGD